MTLNIMFCKLLMFSWSTFLRNRNSSDFVSPKECWSLLPACKTIKDYWSEIEIQSCKHQEFDLQFFSCIILIIKIQDQRHVEREEMRVKNKFVGVQSLMHFRGLRLTLMSIDFHRFVIFGSWNRNMLLWRVPFVKLIIFFGFWHAQLLIGTNYSVPHSLPPSLRDNSENLTTFYILYVCTLQLKAF